MQSKSRRLSIWPSWRSARAIEIGRLRWLTAHGTVTAEQVDEIYAGCVEKLRRGLREKISALPQDSAMRADFERMVGLPPEALMDEFWSRAHPNPERMGCPSNEVLVALARRERPIGDPAYDHLGECSPCFIEMCALQEATSPRRGH